MWSPQTSASQLFNPNLHGSTERHCIYIYSYVLCGVVAHQLFLTIWLHFLAFSIAIFSYITFNQDYTPFTASLTLHFHSLKSTGTSMVSFSSMSFISIDTSRVRIMHSHPEYALCIRFSVGFLGLAQHYGVGYF